MKQLNCKDLGLKCNKVLTAQTEEPLVDLAAMHLREVHGVSAITPEIVSRIRNSFINRTALDAADDVDRIFEKYNCNREPECTWRYIEEAEMILKGDARGHGRELRAA